MKLEKQLRKMFLTGAGYDLYGEKILALIKSHDEEVYQKLSKIDLIEPCEPECTPERHVYHQGTWDSQIKLEKELAKMKGQE